MSVPTLGTSAVTVSVNVEVAPLQYVVPLQTVTAAVVPTAEEDNAGGTAMLTVTLPGSGNYEYLSTKASQAAAGMKGFVIVRLSDANPGSDDFANATGAPGTNPKSSTGSSSAGNTTAWGPDGEAPDPTCPPGMFIAFTGAPGVGLTDQDDDNEGGFPSDHDGCV